MRAMLRAALTAAIVLAPGVPACADEQSEALAVIDKAIKAMGGDQKVDSLKSAIYKAKGLAKDGGQDIQIEAEVSARGLGQYRVDMEVNVQGQSRKMLVVLNGEQGWMKTMDRVEDAPNGVAAAVQQAFLGPRTATLLSLLKDKETKLSPLGEVKVNDRPTLGIKVLRKDFREFDLYFDKETSLPVKCDSRITNPNGQEESIEYEFSGPKEVSGLKHFTKLVVKIKGPGTVEFELTELKTNEKLGDDLFAKP